VFLNGNKLFVLRIIKLALLSFFFFGVLLWLFSLLIPSEVRISRAVNLSRRAEMTARGMIEDTGLWKQWNPMFSRDSSSGDRKVMVSKAEGKDLRFSVNAGGRPFTSEFQFIGYPSGDSITLQWYSIFKLRPLPWERFESLLYEDTYGEVMQRGLQNLKTSAP
jgi:hypothetical protein